RKGKVPRLALANGLWLGKVPEELKSLRFVEKILIARVRHTCSYSVLRSGPVRFFCLFWMNRNRNRLPNLEIQKKPDRNRQEPPKTGFLRFELVSNGTWFELTKTGIFVVFYA